MQKVDVYTLQENAFDLIGKQWAMITTRHGEKVNTMTASWGGVGVMWNKPVAYLFLRPQRYTRELLDASVDFSVCFLPESQRAAMGYCGKHSGRDEEKLAACSLHAAEVDGVTVLRESRLALTCKKLFCQPLKPESFVDTSIIETCYPQSDFHLMYVAEITGAYTGDVV